VADEQTWVDHRVRTYYTRMGPRQRAALDHRVRRAIDDDGGRRERARRTVGLADRLRHRPHGSATEEQISTIFALSGPWSWQTIRGADAEQAIERLEAERGRRTDRGAAVASVRAVLRLTDKAVRHRELEGAIDAASEARERAVTRGARQRTTARTDELCREWLGRDRPPSDHDRAAEAPPDRPPPVAGSEIEAQEVARWR
jgi:hypothetical protein